MPGGFLDHCWADLGTCVGRNFGRVSSKRRQVAVWRAGGLVADGRTSTSGILKTEVAAYFGDTAGRAMDCCRTEFSTIVGRSWGTCTERLLEQ